MTEARNAEEVESQLCGCSLSSLQSSQRERWKEGCPKEEGFHRLEDVAQGRAERALPGTTWACMGKEDRR